MWAVSRSSTILSTRWSTNMLTGSRAIHRCIPALRMNPRIYPRTSLHAEPIPQLSLFHTGTNGFLQTNFHAETLNDHVHPPDLCRVELETVPVELRVSRREENLAKWKLERVKKWKENRGKQSRMLKRSLVHVPCLLATICQRASRRTRRRPEDGQNAARQLHSLQRTTVLFHVVSLVWV